MGAPAPLLQPEPNESTPRFTGPATVTVPDRRARIDSVDLLRGLVMVIMLLDHTRDFVHSET